VVDAATAASGATQSSAVRYGGARLAKRARKENQMRKLLFALSAVGALALTAAQAPVKTFTCGVWQNGVCVKMHRVKGGPAPYAVGYVFGPNYAYTTLSDIPQPVVTYYKLDTNKRYVYKDGYLYEVDPATYAVTQVIDTYAH
jgi:hypothetical protein